MFKKPLFAISQSIRRFPADFDLNLSELKGKFENNGVQIQNVLFAFCRKEKRVLKYIKFPRENIARV